MPETKITDVQAALHWEEAVLLQERAKEKAARQFLALWRRHRGRKDPELRWGEEIEYLLVDLEGGEARAALYGHEVLQRLGPETGGEDPTAGAGWRTEYGDMMVEGVTHPPFGGALDEVLRLEPALAWRRRQLESVAAEVRSSLRVATLSAFPLLGLPGCTEPRAAPAPEGDLSKSLLCPDQAISPHPRYQSFTINYRKRKGCKVAALIPRESVLQEQRLSPEALARAPFDIARSPQLRRERDPVPGHIYMDSQAFGACQCATQVTFLAKDLEEARCLTDQFLVLAPLLLALTAATPFLRGLVADTDTRWETFKQCWDDRSEAELASLRNSRASANDLFIGPALAADPAREGAANDVKVPVHAPALEELERAGVDGLLARHVAHLLVRDALVLFAERIAVDDDLQTDHLDQLQGTNWGTVRFKPPLCDGSIGWRVEFRSPEVQVTDFENAAVVGLLRLLWEAIADEGWDLVMPMSRCDENDAASAGRNAASEGLFWFPELPAPPAAAPTCASRGDDAAPSAPKRARATGPPSTSTPPRRQRLREILSEAASGGLFGRCRQLLARRRAEGRCSLEASQRFESYMRLFERRASGDLPTPAGFLRERLRVHPEYRGDGVLPGAFVHDLVFWAAEVNRPGAEWPTELLGPRP